MPNEANKKKHYSERSVEQRKQAIQNEQSTSTMQSQEDKKTKGPNRPST